MFDVARAVSAVVAVGVAIGGAAPARSDPPAQGASIQSAPVRIAAADPTPADATYVIIGADPMERYDIEKVTIENGEVRRFEKGRLFQIYSVGEDGFLLLEVAPGDLLAIRATYLGINRLMPGPRFKPCGKTLAFSARPGTVGYVAQINHVGLSTRFSNDLGSARAYLARVHPELAPRLEQAHLEQARLPRMLDCESAF